MNGERTDVRRVTVSSDVVDGKVMVRDTLGREREINASTRVGAGPAPRQGELWLMLTMPGAPRMLLSRISTPDPPVVAGTRTGNTALVLSLLDALSSLGLIDDQSTP